MVGHVLREPRQHRLALEALQRVEAELRHPLGLVLAPRDLADDLLVQALLGLEDALLGVVPAELVLAQIDALDSHGPSPPRPVAGHRSTPAIGPRGGPVSPGINTTQIVTIPGPPDNPGRPGAARIYGVGDRGGRRRAGLRAGRGGRGGRRPARSTSVGRRRRARRSALACATSAAACLYVVGVGREVLVRERLRSAWVEELVRLGEQLGDRRVARRAAVFVVGGPGVVVVVVALGVVPPGVGRATFGSSTAGVVPASRFSTASATLVSSTACSP